MKSLILIGLPGAGKSTIGKLLSKELGLPLFDLDQEIEKTYGQTCREIYMHYGSSYFRNCESEVLLSISKKSDAAYILSPGGGVFESHQNISLLKSIGILIYLTSDIKNLYLRITKNGIPAFLNKGYPLLSFENLAERRNPLYKAAADHTIDTTNKTPEMIVEEIKSLDIFS